MSTLQNILNLNLTENITLDVAISDRLKNEDGSYMKFKIKPMLFDTFNILKKRASSIDKLGNVQIDDAKLSSLVVTECTIEPSFKDAKSIELLNANSPMLYLNKVLLAGEIEMLSKEIFKLSGFVDDFYGLVDDIKN